jgi:hypothetical protein
MSSWDTSRHSAAPPAPLTGGRRRWHFDLRRLLLNLGLAGVVAGVWAWAGIGLLRLLG